MKKKLLLEIKRMHEIMQITENIKSLDDWHSEEHLIMFEIFHMIRSKEKVKFELIKPTVYHAALREFTKFGKFIDRFPVKNIFLWKELILTNISMLNALTDLSGHSSSFPYQEFLDEFDYSEPYTSNQYDMFTGGLTEVKPEGEFTKWRKEKYEKTGKKTYNAECSFQAAYEFLDEVYDMDEYLPLFSNGEWVLSDFGLGPLLEIGEIMADEDDPNELIVLINKALDVTHPRSDLAELFIMGGSESLDIISNM